MKKINLKTKYIVFLVMAGLVSICLYYSYAIFMTKQLQENVVVLKTLDNPVVVSIDGKNKVEIPQNSTKDIKLHLQNTIETEYYYEIFFKKDDSGIMVTGSDDIKGKILNKEEKEIKVQIINNNDKDIEIEFLVKTSLNDDILKDIGYSYINNINSFDHSKANKPDLSNLKLIPVSYKVVSDTEGFWYKTDINNNKDLWYDYDSGIWANAILVSNNNYAKYQKKEIGTEIEISDVLGFFVWIPRFKYTVLNYNNYTNFERLNNIIFEEKNNSTGTITCEDKLSNSLESHIYSEVCKDNVFNKISENLSTYTHPAFQDKAGFWVSKFLMGEGNTTRSLPNIGILKKNVSDAIELSNKMINNHSSLLTNMEYASIVMLTDSMYGKSGNKLYLDNDYTFKRVYINNFANNLTGCSSDYNTFSKSFITSTSKTCTEYNNLTNMSHVSNSVQLNVGPVGPGASTTGTIYGVYDMANINGELVNTFTANENGESKMTNQTLDLYSYNDYVGTISSSNNIINLNRYKLGDAIKENIRVIKMNGMWQNGFLEQQVKEGVMLRGGNGDIKNASIYTASIVDLEKEAPFRVVVK